MDEVLLELARPASAKPGLTLLGAPAEPVIAEPALALTIPRTGDLLQLHIVPLLLVELLDDLVLLAVRL